MGTTQNYGWPIPEYGEPTDVPTDLNDLGSAIDVTVKAIDTRVDTHTHSYLPLAGGTVSGPVSGVTPGAASHLTRKDYVDGEVAKALPLVGGAMTGPVHGVAPTADTHLTRKDYVDSRVGSQSKITYGSGDPPTSGMKAGDVHFKYQ